MSAAPDLSVVIPAHNGERFIAQAVRSAQHQTPPPAEIIIVDDGSTDGTASVVKELPGVRYVHQAKGGPAAARNHGVRLARGRLLAFLDADDRWTEDKTAIQLELLGRDRATEIVIGHSQRVILTEWQGDEPVYRSVGEPVFYLHLGSALFRRPSFDRVGWFDERLLMGEDVDWYLRAKELGVRIRFHREVTQYYLKHDTNVTLQRDESNRALVRAFKGSLDRRRETAPDAPAPLGDWSEETQWLREAP